MVPGTNRYLKIACCAYCSHKLPKKVTGRSARAHARPCDNRPVPSVIQAPPSAEWPFTYPLCPELPSGPVEIHARNVEDAYVNEQAGTQLVTTQKTYLDAEWSAALARHGNARLAIAEDTEKDGGRGVVHPLALAFRLADPAERLARCVEFLKSGRTAAALVATASVCVEVNDLDAAARDLDEAIAQAPEWRPRITSAASCGCEPTTC